MRVYIDVISLCIWFVLHDLRTAGSRGNYTYNSASMGRFRAACACYCLLSSESIFH